MITYRRIAHNWWAVFVGGLMVGAYFFKMEWTEKDIHDLFFYGAAFDA